MVRKSRSPNLCKRICSGKKEVFDTFANKNNNSSWLQNASFA